MCDFELVPVDGGDPVHLPPGETLLGRGPFLGVGDKRVSRHHGLLENLNGQLRLKPTHVNPCFVQSSLTDQPRPLQRNSWYPLHAGDLFSLLPGQLIYRVVATPRKSQMFEEGEDLPLSPQPDVEPQRAQTPPLDQARAAGPSHQDEADRSSDKDSSTAGGVAATAPKRRVLPAWMMMVVAAPPRSSSSPKGFTGTSRSAVKGGKQAAAAKKSSSLEEEEEEEVEEVEEEVEDDRSKKRRRKTHRDEEAAQSETVVPSEPPTVWPQNQPDESEASNDSDGFSAEAGSSTRGQETVRADRDQRRAPCPYGKDCYRKNPVHFQECSHPGDTDYEEQQEEEEEEGEDRPECPYGTDCYRKNPLHRKEYKHTKRPVLRTRPGRRTPHAARGDEADGGDDSDDSFMDDDSDYAPPDSDDSGEEDVRRLQREAQAFLKKRK